MNLVGGFNHLEKYESQWEGLSHILWKIKFMFETTNQDFSINAYMLHDVPMISTDMAAICSCGQILFFFQAT